MHHDAFRNGDLLRVHSPARVVDDGIGEKWRRYSIAKGHHLPGLDIDLWMSGEVMVERAIEVMFPFCFEIRQADLVWGPSLHHGEQLTIVNNHCRIACVLCFRHFAFGKVIANHVESGIDPTTLCPLLAEAS